MFSANLFEVARVQMAERQQRFLAADQVRAGLREQVQPPGLRRLIAAVRASIADSLHYVRTTPEPLSAAADITSQRVLA